MFTLTRSARVTAVVEAIQSGASLRLNAWSAATALLAFVLVGLLQSCATTLDDSKLKTLTEGVTQELGDLADKLQPKRPKPAVSIQQGSIAWDGIPDSESKPTITKPTSPNPLDLRGSGSLALRIGTVTCESRPALQLISNVTVFDWLSIRTLKGLFEVGVNTRADTDVLKRYVEVCLLNTNDDLRGNQLTLCQGTARPAGKQNCAAVADAFDRTRSDGAFAEIAAACRGADDAHPSALRCLGMYLDSKRNLALVTGVIQYVTFALFVFAAVHLRLYLRGRSVTTMTKFAKIEKARDVATLAPAYREVFTTARNALSVLSQLKDEKSNRGDLVRAEVEAVQRVGDKHAYAKFCEESKLQLYGFAMDTMVKLAFIGTIVGIAYALFAAPTVDSSNVLARLTARFALYNSLATAFGTTLVGVLLTVVLGTLVYRARQSTDRDIQDAISRANLFIAEFAKQKETVGYEPTPFEPMDRRTLPSFPHWFLFLGAVLLIMAGIAYWALR